MATTIDERLLTLNRHGSLAMPGALWLAMAFLARYWIVVSMVLLGARRSPDTIRLLGQDFAWIMLALEFPVVLLMLAAANRRPDAGALWRLVWGNGRAIMIAIAAVHLAMAAAALWTTPVWRRWPELFIASCALLDVAVIYALIKDRFFTQLFADFPRAAAPANTE